MASVVDCILQLVRVLEMAHPEVVELPVEVCVPRISAVDPQTPHIKFNKGSQK